MLAVLLLPHWIDLMSAYTISSVTGFAHLSDLPCVKLQFGAASAVVSLYGAQVLSYQPSPQQEVLWRSPLARWHDNTPIRGGVPLCWPWFGPIDAKINLHAQRLPNHGLVRTRLWQLVGQHQDSQGVSVTLQIQLDALPHLAKPVTLELTVCLADSLSITVRCDSALLQQAALHSYFSLTDISKVQVSPLPKQYVDKVSDTQVLSDSETVEIDGEVDRVYCQPHAQLLLTHPGAALVINQQGQDATVIWNPWQQRCEQITDLPDDAFNHFICVETARLQLSAPSPLQLTQQLTLT
jgi:glucose-6-phosphate 1-epimerase